MNKGFTLTELIIVTAIVGIMVAFDSPQFAVTKERGLDKEARATLALIQAAEKVYRQEIISYFPTPSGTTSNIPTINNSLRLNLPASSKWTYTVDSTAQQATAAHSGRTCTLTFTGSDSTCSGAGCP